MSGAVAACHFVGVGEPGGLVLEVHVCLVALAVRGSTRRALYALPLRGGCVSRVSNEAMGAQSSSG